MDFIGRNYDQALQDQESNVFLNVNQHYREDDYGEIALLDWKDTRIDPEDRVYIVTFKKDFKLVPTMMPDEFLNEYLATDENLIDLFDEKENDLYWGMEIIKGKDLM